MKIWSCALGRLAPTLLFAAAAVDGSIKILGSVRRSALPEEDLAIWRRLFSPLEWQIKIPIAETLVNASSTQVSIVASVSMHLAETSSRLGQIVEIVVDRKHGSVSYQRAWAGRVAKESRIDSTKRLILARSILSVSR